MKISPLFSLFQHLFIWKPFAPTSPPFQLRMFYNCCSNDISVRNRLLEHTAWGKKYGSNRSRTYIIAVHSVCTHENNKSKTHASHWCRAVLRASVRPHEAQTRIILNALFYSHALALVLYEMGCGCAILVAWYDRVSFTRETSTMHDYLNRRSLNFFRLVLLSRDAILCGIWYVWRPCSPYIHWNRLREPTKNTKKNCSAVSF